MTDISAFGFADDLSFVRHLIENVGVAAVPGSSFFSDSGISNSSPGSALIRFCFCKKYETLEKAGSRLRRI
jgi:aminotransferase